MVCDVALADFFSGVAPVCLIIASIVLLITVYRLRVASLVDCEGAKAKRNFLARVPRSFRLRIVAISATSLRSDREAATASRLTWRAAHVTLNCFDGSAHMFLSFL